MGVTMAVGKGRRELLGGPPGCLATVEWVAALKDINIIAVGIIDEIIYNIGDPKLGI